MHLNYLLILVENRFRQNIKIIVFLGNPFEMRLLNLRINFLFFFIFILVVGAIDNNYGRQ